MIIMKRFFILILISVFSVVTAQQSKNRFEEGEHSGFERNVDHTNDQKTDDPQPGPGNPGDPVPIDQYIPFMVLAAVGIIVYHTRQSKMLPKNTDK